MMARFWLGTASYGHVPDALACNVQAGFAPKQWGQPAAMIFGNTINATTQIRPLRRCSIERHPTDARIAPNFASGPMTTRCRDDKSAVATNATFDAIVASAIAAIMTITTAGRSTLEQSGSIVPVQQQTPADDCHADTPKQCEVAKVRHSRTRHSRPSRVKTRDTGSIPGRRDRETKCACRAPIGTGPPRPRATNLHRFGRQRRSSTRLWDTDVAESVCN